MKRFSIFAFTLAAIVTGGLLAEARPGWLFPKRERAVQQEAPEARRPTASITADAESVLKGGTATITWVGSNGTATLNDEAVELSGSRTVTVDATMTWTFTVAGRRRTAEKSVTVAVTDITPDPTPTPEPVDGFSLSAVGIGSAFAIDDALSAASRDHELGAFIASQNGTWTIITDEVMAAKHPAAFDKWVAKLAESKKATPAVIWHNAGKILAIDEVAGKSKADLLQMAKAQVPASNTQVVIRGKARPLGLKPAKKGAKYSGPSVSTILKPLAAKDCPSVNLRTQALYLKDQTGGTCVLNAFSLAQESLLYAAYGKENAIQLSPYFLANLTNGYNGTYALDAAEAIQKYGNLPFGDMAPYDKLPTGWRVKAANYQCLAIYGPPDSDPQGYIRAALHRGYIVPTGISVGSGFDPDADGYISYDRGAGNSVNHEICTVAYDQVKDRYGIINSWGDWGNNGFAWLDSRFFKSDTDIWVPVAMAAAPSYKFYEPVADKESRPRPPALNPKITASATQINAGDQAIVMWTNTTSTVLCTLNGQAVAVNGQQEVYPTKDATYSIIAYDRNGNTQAAWVRIEVLPVAQKATKLLEAPVLNAIEASKVPLPEQAATPPEAKADSPCANGNCPSGNCGYASPSRGWRFRR